MFRSPLILATIAAVTVVFIIVSAELFRDLADERAQLTREQRKREDEARRHQASIEERNFWMDAVATTLDPIGLFH